MQISVSCIPIVIRDEYFHFKIVKSIKILITSISFFSDTMPAVKSDTMRGLAVFISDIRNCKCLSPFFSPLLLPGSPMSFSGKSKEAEVKRINKELANIRSKFKGNFIALIKGLFFSIVKNKIKKCFQVFYEITSIVFCKLFTLRNPTLRVNYLFVSFSRKHSI